jgi:hypothetical protein
MQSNGKRRPRGAIRRSTATVAIVAALLGGLSVAGATEHLMSIQEVFVGPPGDGIAPNLTPNQRAQYVMLRMTSSGQTLVANDVIRVEDKDGNILGNFGTFASNVGTGGTIGCSYPTCPALILGTQAAKNLFSFTFDTIVDPQAGRVALPSDGGRVCFKDGGSANVYDCVAWGNFSCKPANCSGPNTMHIGDSNVGNGCDSNFDTPAAATTGLQFGRSLARTAFNCAAKSNSTQFALAFPRPVNNAGANNNTAADADGLIDALDCNDASNQIYWPAIEVQGQRVTRVSLTTVTDAWADQSSTSGPGVSYDEIRGHLSKVANFTDVACHTPNTTLTSSDDPDLPATGDGFYYLVRAGSGTGCVGTYGDSTVTPDPRDSLDSSGPCP